MLLAIAALVPITLFFITSLSRLHYPFPLEQLEGSMLLAAERVAQGLPIYIRPNFHFIPFMYGPAYYYVSGWAIRWLGAGFFPLRLISLVSTCGTLAIIYVFVLLDTRGTGRRRHLAALCGAGLYAAAYPWTREWFDLARLDSFYIFLLLLALLCTRFSRRIHPVVAAALWTLAFLAKQTILPVALVMLCHDWKRPRRLIAGVVSFLAFAAVSTGLLNHATQGWFRFYTFTVPHANADLLLRPAVFYIPQQVLAPFGMALLVIAVSWMGSYSAAPGRMLHSIAGRFYLLAAGSTFGLCWFLQAHGGATSNTPMPVYAVVAILFGIAFGRIDASLAAEGRGITAAHSIRTMRESMQDPIRVLLLAGVGIPLLAWVYSPREFIPHPDLTSSNQQLIAWARTFPGDVFLPAHPYEATLAGKPWHPDIAALHDALRPEIPSIRQPLLEEIRELVESERFDAIALDGTPEQALAEQPWLPSDTARHYPLLGKIPGSDIWDGFAPHPTFFLLPCREKALAVAQGWTLLETAGQSSCPH
ncbi:MAG: hypothetical protein ABI164_03175 [Acidobacteriaceae bacterium]